jgi:N-methylhydantoinase B/oxoprolinase/acetone carboxylase alpha subunit
VALLGNDVGGTFTDAGLVDYGRVRSPCLLRLARSTRRRPRPTHTPVRSPGATLQLVAGDVITVETPGGGGFG